MEHLLDGWIITKNYRGFEFILETIVHVHPEGSWSMLTTAHEECPGCGEALPEQFRMIHLLRRLNDV